MIKIATIIVLTAMLGGCSSLCAGFHEIEPSSQDKLTDGTAKQILQHNEYGARAGCWRGR